jgi:rubredoxin
VAGCFRHQIHRQNAGRREAGLVTSDFRKWQCILCGFVYDEVLGLPDDGSAAGTRWEYVPDDWVCPHCAATKADFDMVLIHNTNAT